jgi:N-dimethylarginine dimethylaminohydrolase
MEAALDVAVAEKERTVVRAKRKLEQDEDLQFQERNIALHQTHQNVLHLECYVCKLDESFSGLSRLGWV